MIRSSVDFGAANAFIGGAGSDQGVVFQFHGNDGDKTTHHKMIYRNSVNSFYVKLSKTSNTVMAFYKSEAKDEWIRMGSVELTLTGSMVLVGRAITKGMITCLQLILCILRIMAKLKQTYWQERI